MMADPIYRQAAIDALIEWYGCKPNDIEAFEEILEALPSAQPELEIVRCKDCKHRYGKACDFADFWLKDDDYCSRGERKGKNNGEI